MKRIFVMKTGETVLVTTEHRGVFFGTLKEQNDNQVTLTEARCAIKFGTTEGFLELAEKGPNGNSKIGATAPEIELSKVTSVTKVTPAAAKAWKSC